MRRFLGLLFCLLAVPSIASADVRTGDRDDPTDAPLHQNVDGSSYRDPDIQKVALKYDTAGSIALTVTYLDPLPNRQYSGSSVTVSSSEYKVANPVLYSGAGCASTEQADARIVFYPQRQTDQYSGGTINLQGFEGTLAAQTSVSADGRTLTVSATASTLANRGYKCVGTVYQGTASNDSTTPFRLFGLGAYDKATLAACENEVDDDGDGTTDLADRGCANQKGTSEVAPECNDGLDNDGDGGIDFYGVNSFGEYDDGCASSVDPSENDNPCSDLTDDDDDGYTDAADIDSNKPAPMNCDQDEDRHTVPVVKKKLTSASATAYANQYLAGKYSVLRSPYVKRYVKCPKREILNFGKGKRALCAFEFHTDASRRKAVAGEFLVGIKANEFFAEIFSSRRFSQKLRTCHLRDLKRYRIVNRRLQAGGLVGCRNELLIGDLHYLKAGKRRIAFHGTNRAGFEEQVVFHCKLKRHGHRYSATCSNQLGDRFIYKFTKVPKPKPKPKPKKPAAHRNCDPSYGGQCLKPNASDYDCAGGSGDGPLYVYGVVTITGSDPYDLDADGDGYGCEDD